MPDVYQGSILPITSFLALVPKLIYIIIVLKFVFLLHYFNLNLLLFEYFFLIVSLFSLIVGTLGALNQIKIKRFIAYSTIAHMSYILFSVIFIQSLENFIFLFFYLSIYLILNLGIFSLLISFSHLKIFNNISSFSLKFSIINDQ